MDQLINREIKKENMGKKNGSYFWIFGHQTSWLSKVNPDDAENTTSKSHGP